MKIFYILFLVAASQGLHLCQEWELFKKTHGKFYSSPGEEELRMDIFNKNKLKIEEHNKKYEQGLVSYFLKLNHFSDMAPEELISMKNDPSHTSRFSEKPTGPLFEPSNSSAVPDSLDWRDKGAVTTIKFQWLCSSWPFSATGALESHHFIKTGKLVSLSEQQLIDCSKSYGNRGCSGGSAERAFNYTAHNGGIDTETIYPYLGLGLFCRYKKSGVGAKNTGYMMIPEGDEEALKNAVATVGPVSIAMDIDNGDFAHYGGGIYYNEKCTTTNLDHSMLVVGYGRLSDIMGDFDYWIVKNSYSKYWGEDGYLKVARNKNNHCGIASRASYPTM